MHRILLSLLLAAASTYAASVTLTLDSNSLSALPGQVITFSGTVNNGLGSEVFLNTLNVNLAGGGLTTDSLVFFLGPASVNGLTTTPSFDWFTVTVANPFNFPFGAYSGTIDLLGGADAFAQDILSQTTFTVTVLDPATVVPEPALAPGVLALALGYWGYRRRQ